MKIHVVELFDPLGVEYCTFWFYSIVEKARHLFITQTIVRYILDLDSRAFAPRLCKMADIANKLLAVRSSEPVSKH
jgi:hypothetical protein